MAGRNFLFVPGPTNVPDRITRAMMKVAGKLFRIGPIAATERVAATKTGVAA